MFWRVVCGLSETIDTFSPSSWLSSVDFPELGRPMMETKPDLNMENFDWKNPGRHRRPIRFRVSSCLRQLGADRTSALPG